MVALLNAINDTEEQNWKLEGCQNRQVLGVDLAMHFFHGWTCLCNVDLYSVQLLYSAFSNLQVWQVTDTGMGLNPQDIPSLFNKFLHADSTTTRNYGGTGLGLAICKRYCQCGQLESLVLVTFAGMLVVCT
jgi:signal transduction histidine kinase